MRTTIPYYRRGILKVAACVAMTAVGCVDIAEPPIVDHTTRSLSRPGTFVQRGTARVEGDAELVVDIEAVDPSRAFLLLSTRHDSNDPDGSVVRGKLLDGSRIKFDRPTDQANAIDISWTVVEYASGVRVQRGEAALATNVIDVAIDPVASLAQTFVTYSKTTDPANSIWNENDPLVVELRSVDSVQFRANADDQNGVVSWQVIEFLDPELASVQRGTESALGTVSLATAVDLDRAFLLASYNIIGGDAAVGARMMVAELVDANTLDFRRDVQADLNEVSEISWQVVELHDGTRVQHGTQTFVANEATQVVEGVFDVSRAAALSTVQAGPGQSLGATDFVGDDIIGVASATLDLDSTSLTVQRTNTAAGATISWSVVEFGPVCGDGVIEGDEQCEGGPCCIDCGIAAAGTECRASTGACDPAETCDGGSSECPSDSVIPDTDADEVCDPDDNCPADANTDQADADADGVGDVCDESTVVDPDPEPEPVEPEEPTSALACSTSGNSHNGGWWLLFAVLLARGRRRRRP